MRRTADIRLARANRAVRVDFLGDVPMTSWRPDKETDGAGLSIGLAIVGLLAAGLGLVTMHTAFKPLPKPGVPVVISHAATPVAEASWRHAPAARPAAPDAESPDVDETPAPERPARHLAVHADALQTHALEPAAAKPAPATTPASLISAKATVQQVATAEVPGEKLCKAPSPQVLSAKTLQTAMILRYDARKVRPLDIPPPQPSSDDTERRLKLSALLGHMLEN